MPTSFLIPDSGSGPQGAGETALSELIGEDILFLDDFQETGDGDYVTVKDNEVIRQAIYRRLIVRPGEYKLRPEYGIGVQDFVKGKITQSRLDELSRRIQDNLLQDTRIERVIEVVCQRVTVESRPGARVYVKVEIAGQVRTVRPFTFVQQA